MEKGKRERERNRKIYAPIDSLMPWVQASSADLQ